MDDESDNEIMSEEESVNSIYYYEDDEENDFTTRQEEQFIYESKIKKRWETKEALLRAEQAVIKEEEAKKLDAARDKKTSNDSAEDTPFAKGPAVGEDEILKGPKTFNTLGTEGPSAMITATGSAGAAGVGMKKMANKESMFTSGASSKVLMSDLLGLMRQRTEELGYTIDAVDDNIYHWNVTISKFDSGSEIFQDMRILERKHGYCYVEVHLHFAMDLYPYYPPLVTIIRPRFEGNMLGRVANLKCLQLSHWDPLAGAKKCIEAIRNEFQKPESSLVDSPMNSLMCTAGSYSPLEHLLLRLSIVSEVAPISKGGDVSTAKSGDEDVNANANEDCSREVPMQAEKVAANDDSTTSSSSSSSSSSNYTSTGKRTSAELWAKGTGYGSGNDVGDWDPDAYIAAQKKKDKHQEETLTALLRHTKIHVDEIQKHMHTDGVSSSASACANVNVSEGDDQEQVQTRSCFKSIEALCDVLEESCLLPHMLQYINTESLLELERHSTICIRVFSLLEFIGLAPHLRPLLVVPLKSSASSTITCIGDACNLMEKRLSKCLKNLRKVECSSDAGAAINKSTTELRVAAESDHTMFMEYLVHVCRLVVSTGMYSDTNAAAVADYPSCNAGIFEVDQTYKQAMLPLQFIELDTAFANFHYTPAITEVACNRARAKRLAQEHADLAHESTLPLALSSTVWVRTWERRMDMMQVMISGPNDTPYENACFIFDVFFPAGYPANPPKVNLKTTGSGQVRFNPNLYNCGKVCLSLLGTWHGAHGESWHDKTSTFLQVIVSIQSLILVPDPYFNEPGYQKEINTPKGDTSSYIYNATIKEATLKFGMIDHLIHLQTNSSKNSSISGFADVLKLHFTLKRAEIEEQVEKWCVVAETKRNEYTGSKINGHPETMRSLQKELKTLLRAL